MEQTLDPKPLHLLNPKLRKPYTLGPKTLSHQFQCRSFHRAVYLEGRGT